MMWQGYRIAVPEDTGRLDADYGHRVSLGLPGDLAARSAYSDYRRALHNEAAAHHLKASQRAAEGGNREVAERHRVLYRSHLNAAGHGRSRAGVPSEVQAHLNAVVDPGHRFFTAHRSDQLLGH